MDALEVVIRMRGVTKIYRRSHLGRTQEIVGVSGLDLEVGRGEAFGLLGLNGSGKTTTIKLLMGLLYPTRGSLEVFGKPMPDPAALARIGYLPEAAYLNRYLTGRETIELFATLGGLSKERRAQAVPRMIERVGMDRWSDKRIGDYSKGMVQRIGIGQALVHEPELLILDEPITGLDPLAIHEIRTLILWLKKNGKTVLLSSHDISEVERVCDRIGILAGGRLARVVEASEWRESPDRLEEIFEAAVRGSESVGPLRFE